MSVHPGKRRGKRVYVRAFDHDEAQRRYDAGESTSALAAEYGVTENAVYQVVTEAGRRAASRSAENFRARHEGQGVCDRCGGPMNLASRLYCGAKLCKSCADDDMATSVQPDALRCATCGEWKPDEDFPHDAGGRQRRRGRHKQCRVCLTIVRQDYRERHKVPCIGCGEPALPPNEKRTNGSGLARCRSCANRATALARRHRQASAGRSSGEAVSPRGERGD